MIQEHLRHRRRLFQWGIRAHVLSMFLLAVVFCGFQIYNLFSEKELMYQHEKGILLNISWHSAIPTAEDYILPVLLPDDGEKPRLNVSLPPTSGRALPPSSSLVDEQEKIWKKKEKPEPDWTEDMNHRNCSRERDPLRIKRRINAPIRSIQEITKMLQRNQRSSCLKVPEWSAPVDQEILRARREILSALIVKADPVLYPPVYRNFSIFKKSYEAMEKILKVYVYKEGEKPIFHEPLLWGIYAAEGWFMKHMEENERFLVDDPAKAHLFYMPYSSTILRFKLFDPVVRDKGIMVDQLKHYVAAISAKYPFWNRTGGADHFSVACHDWASIFKVKAMGDSIMAICNAEMNGAFELGKDVSITLTPVRHPRNPLQNVGGMPGRKRDTLAFFAGQMHGQVRPLLFQHWGENRDPDVQVFQRLPRGGGRTYDEHMKRSRFCLCPSGYEVNSPRLAETFFYECVPVIISDNFVPPFFEVLNWEAFSVVVPVKDIPKLKEILQSIPRRKFLALQKGVKKVQRHFLWHLKPKRYDLFYMTLHSIWFNRVLQFRS